MMALPQIFRDVDWANWLSAIGTVGAVMWGYWLTVREDGRRRQDRKEAVHEIASASEEVCKIWDGLIGNLEKLDRSGIGRWLQPYREKLRVVDESIGWLLQRDGLSDGTVRCAVNARQLAETIEARLMEIGKSGVSDPADLRTPLIDFKTRMQDTLDTCRRLRRVHGIRQPREPYAYTTLNPPTHLGTKGPDRPQSG